MFKNIGVKFGNVDPEHQLVHQNQDHTLVGANMRGIVVMMMISLKIMMRKKVGTWKVGEWKYTQMMMI